MLWQATCLHCSSSMSLNFEILKQITCFNCHSSGSLNEVVDNISRLSKLWVTECSCRSFVQNVKALGLTVAEDHISRLAKFWAYCVVAEHLY